MRTLNVAVSGAAADVDRLIQQMDEIAAARLGNDSTTQDLLRFWSASGEPDRTVCQQHHLVVHAGGPTPAWADVSVSSSEDVDQLIDDRLLPWTTKWNDGRRAPRAQVATQRPHDPGWILSGRRLIARLEHATAGLPVLRIDHIGSTSVPGLTAKSLVDIQILVPDTETALPVAIAATDAGFTHVAGEWFGLDRSGGRHPEQVVVDSDPGRPVNCNIRGLDAPVARDAVLFAEWLRADADGRARYQVLKNRLAGQQIDDYGAQKEPHISAALTQAEAWAESTGWTF